MAQKNLTRTRNIANKKPIKFNHLQRIENTNSSGMGSQVFYKETRVDER